VGINREVTPKYIFNILFITGIIILLYHLYKSYIRIKNKMSPWVNLFHIIVIAPLIIFIGYNGRIGINIKRYYFEFLIMLGFSAIGYHLYYIIN
jgi:hypothetical protein